MVENIIIYAGKVTSLQEDHAEAIRDISERLVGVYEETDKGRFVNMQQIT